MSHIKQSYRNKAAENKTSRKKMGDEFGAIIENDPNSYPQTGQWRDQTPIVDREKCTGCGTCAEHCPENAIAIKKIGSSKKAIIDYQFCKGEGLCAEVCPVKAISLKK